MENPEVKENLPILVLLEENKKIVVLNIQYFAKIIKLVSLQVINLQKNF